MSTDRPVSTAPSAGTTAVVAVGGVVGSLLRWGLQEAWPHDADGFPASTLAVNTTGCLAIGVLMVWVGSGRAPAAARPFLGVGLLGGFTTFSAYAVDLPVLVEAGRADLAVLCLVSTVALAIVAVVAGTAVGTALAERRAR